MTTPSDKDERPPFLTLRGFRGGEARVWLDGRIDIIKDHPDVEGFKNAASYQHPPAAVPETQPSRPLSDLIPTNWLDPLLTGPTAVPGIPEDAGPYIERLLSSLKERVKKAERESNVVQSATPRRLVQAMDALMRLYETKWSDEPPQLIEARAALSEALSARSTTQPRHWVYAAAEAHRPLLANWSTVTHGATGPDHVRWMLDKIRDGGFSPTKACRWLGWVQAALNMDGVPLDTLKAVNKAASDAFATASAIQPSTKEKS